MRGQKKHRKYFIVTSLVLLGISLILADEEGTKFAEFDSVDLMPLASNTRESHPKIGYSLYKLYQTHSLIGAAEAELYAWHKGIDYSEGMIRACIFSKPTDDYSILTERNSSVRALVEMVNGTLEGTYLNMNQARIPLETLETISSNPEVAFIGNVRHPEEREVISEGVELIGAYEWMEMSPYRTDHDPVKIAIIDVGFDCYQDLLGEDLPPQFEVVSFRTEPSHSNHGTGCAEIVYDLVPDAEFLFLTVDTLLEFGQAVEYCVDHDVKVISLSIGYYNVGASDGTGPLADIYEYAYRNGIILALAAGNVADKHWLGPFSDPDRDGWTNFTTNDELFEFNGEKEVEYRIYLNWNDWGTWDGVSYSGTDQDFDLYLFQKTQAGWDIIDRSENVQDGDDIPTESLAGVFPSDGKYAIGITSVSGSENSELEVFFVRGTSNREYNVPEYSIVNGDESPFIITVGAFYFYDLSLTPYSSQGPSKDGRVTPDIVAPTQVSTNSRGEYGTGGTSAAAPHVAGAVALILSRLPFSSFEDILSILNARAIDEGEPGKDNKWGAGRLNLR